MFGNWHCGEQNQIKIYEDLINNNNMVFNVKKLLNDNMDLMLWRRVERSNASGMKADLADLGRQ